jgi:hypothetical protein
VDRETIVLFGVLLLVVGILHILAWITWLDRTNNVRFNLCLEAYSKGYQLEGCKR